MAVRTIKLKLVRNREEDTASNAIWTTHVLFNQGVSYYVERLVALRRGLPDASGVSDLLRSARSAQARNGQPGAGSDAEIADLLRSLYEAIVPSCTGGASNSQALSRTFLSPLTDPTSKAGTDASLGRKPKWLHLREADDPAWRKEKRAFDKRRAAGPSDLLVRARREFGLLPLFPSFSDQIGRWEKRTVNTTWDRAMFQMALEHLLAWESWNRKLEDSGKTARLSLPGPTRHPVWTRIGAPGGVMHRYHLRGGKGTGFFVELPLLQVEEGRIVQQVSSFRLARSGQSDRLDLIDHTDVPVEALDRTRRLAQDAKKQWFRLTDEGTDLELYGRFAGAKLQLDRSRLSGLDPEEEHSPGYSGPVYLSVALDIIPAVPELDRITRSFTMFKPDEDLPWMVADIKPEKLQRLPAVHPPAGIDGLQEGLRVLSVEPGARRFATCSVFELIRNPDGHEFAFDIDGTPLGAIHRRTFSLGLAGDGSSGKVKKRRAEVATQRTGLEVALELLNRLLGCTALGVEERRSDLYTLRGDAERSLLPASVLDPLIVHMEDPGGDWLVQVTAAHREWERILAKAFSEWRRNTRRRDNKRGIGGLSFWWIDELTKSRLLSNAWSMHARTPGEVVRSRGSWLAEPEESWRSVDTDKRLLGHINNLKADRIKKGAHQIAMAALGYVYDSQERAWTAKHPPCRLVLFEDHARFQFLQDRPKSENADLMAWEHKALQREVTSQGALSGVRVGTVRGGYISRFSAATGAPGIRVREVSEADLSEPRFVRREIKELRDRGDLRWKEADDLMKLPGRERARQLADHVPPGSLFPYFEGSLFASLDSTGRLVVLDARVNAAQYIQRRFWTRHSEIVRLICKPLEDQPGVYLPVGFGTRHKRALGLGRIVATRKRNEFTWKRASRKTWKALGGEEIGQGTGQHVASGRATFFRDPSGLLFPANRWIPAGHFWKQVKRQVASACAQRT